MFSLLLVAAIVAPSTYAGLLPDVTVSESIEDCEPGSDFIATAWYAGWHASKGYPVSKIKWEKFTHMTYAFATTTPDVHTLGLTEDDKVIPEFIAAAREHNVQTSISVGGWTGSQYFSTAVATPQNRTAFVDTLATLIYQYGFDGIDFDWEYPNHQGVGCNAISPDDTANFLLLLQELRQTPSTANLTLSAAVSLTPFAAPDGTPSTNVSAFADALDFVQIMAYDVWGGWSATVGPNAPLADACAPPDQQQGSAARAVAAWTAAGVPAAQIVLGVPGYGHSFRVDAHSAVGADGALIAHPAFDAKAQPAGDAWDVAGQVVCGAAQPAGGTINFWGLVAAGFLTPAGAPAPGILARYDTCSETAYVYNATSGVEVSYDDARAFAAKGAFIAAQGLRGFAMWEAGGDPDAILLDAIRGAAEAEY